MENNQIFGIRTIIEAVKSGKTIDKVFVQKGLRGDLFGELRTILEKEKIAYSFVPIEKLNRLTRKNHQGVVAMISPIDFYPLEELILSVTESGKNPLFIILDHLSDVRNIGAIIRTAECTGVSGIIIPYKGISISADMVKTSAGAIFNIPICKVDNLVDAIYYLQGSGIKVVGATEKTAQLIYDISYKEPLAIVMGAEDTGISQAVLRVIDERAKLPMFGEISSLNVSVACGVFLYEIVRQRANF
ncbi:23S rRNA (guanosine(2251)-2'-O)-methyltransferase RlmB [Capnocytophaga catalasegens]|uniref:23S rRNA (Guanosine(2251)-2'-O)-methyltransferase RlmB n=1 Tax=Capnocytophaga catalasegens TaxID=1004260 RepID=A0AAV5AYQ8_9FLAO|nr:23S rRNA (guanosine(2251)-2'-O)-methyltransferase RlmB [Capnocytophaga catalasegens]GIZ14485.1 23S rRNA (guanosine(2251)-2'-O)-methyltransferase RlmB [Capnocytophaga catalasegens]GJM50687.1 23S rRNA (guanosine(2251)-2'-O)-methyltransferase RlmB [Capnocytophaga catalasegens]GJM51840.1 23S rRNA (guanosine(2251)-2'-O)-methyltransferase RlmB [Capnocytophaga catalasegens]